MSGTAMRLFDQDEFRKSSRVDRIYIDMINPGKYSLSSAETKYKFVLKRAMVIVSENINHNKTLNIIRDIEAPCSRFEAATILNDAESLYGRFRTVNKEVLRIQLIDRLTREMEKAVLLGKQEIIIKIAQTLAKVSRMDKDDVEDFDYSTLELPAIIYSNDPTVLNRDNDDYGEEE